MYKVISRVGSRTYVTVAVCETHAEAMRVLLGKNASWRLFIQEA